MLKKHTDHALIPKNSELIIDTIKKGFKYPRKKITNSFFDMFGIKENEISIQNITGHFGNPISMLGLEIKNKSTREFIKLA